MHMKIVSICALLVLMSCVADASSDGDLGYLMIDLRQQAKLTKSVCLARDAEESAALSERYQQWLRTNEPVLLEIEKIKKDEIEAALEGKDLAEKIKIRAGFAALSLLGVPMMQEQFSKMKENEIKGYCRAAFANPGTIDASVEEYHRFFIRQAEATARRKTLCVQANEERAQGGINDCPIDCACQALTPAQVEQKKLVDDEKIRIRQVEEAGHARIAAEARQKELDAFAQTLQGDIINGNFAHFEQHLSDGADINLVLTGPGMQNNRAPLLIALDKPESAPFALALIERGANLTPEGLYEGVTLMMLAAGGSTPEVMKVLLARQYFELNQRNPKGATALSYAVLGGRIENVQLLLQLGADTQISTNDGSLIELARLQGYTKIVELLEQYQR